jgi:putative FmdB family regulatory protein
MPIHEYACRDCGHHFERLVRASDAPGSLTCPRCAGAALDKQLSVFATAGAPEAAQLRAATPCGSCGHPAGPGACHFTPVH